MIVEFILILVAIFAYYYHKITKQFGFFKDQGVPYSKPSFPFGSPAAKKMITGQTSFMDVEREIIKEEFPKEKIFGYFALGQPTYVIRDQELIKNIMIKDFEYFTDIRSITDSNKYNNAFLTNLSGDKWKQMRSFMGRVLTVSRLKLMSKQMIKVGEQFEKHLESVAEKGEEVDSRALGSEMTLDAIARAGFGIDIDSFKDPDNMFRKMALTLVNAPGYTSSFFMFKLLLCMALPWSVKLFNIQLWDKKAMDFIIDVIKKSVKHRRESSEKSKDIIGQILEELDNKNAEPKVDTYESDFEKDAAIDTSNLKDIKDSEFDDETLLISNSLLLFFAGLDTTSFGLGICCHKLAKYPEAQDKLIQELDDVIGDTEVTYEKVNNLKYMDWFIAESFRVNSADNFGVHERLCTKDYRIPGTNFIIPKGMHVKMVFEEMMHSKDNFVNPAEFDPENFNPENNPNRFAYQAFGQGPRSCIGMRYGLVMVKFGLVYMLRKHRVVRSPRTVDRLLADPANPTGFKDGSYVKFEQRD